MRTVPSSLCSPIFWQRLLWQQIKAANWVKGGIKLLSVCTHLIRSVILFAQTCFCSDVPLVTDWLFHQLHCFFLSSGDPNEQIALDPQFCGNNWLQYRSHFIFGASNRTSLGRAERRSHRILRRAIAWPGHGLERCYVKFMTARRIWHMQPLRVLLCVFANHNWQSFNQHNKSELTQMKVDCF